MNFESSDLITIGLLILIEGLLSADNAIVLAIQVLPLPPDEQKKALKYGIFGAFFFRIVAVMLATYLLAFDPLKIIGGLYLCYLAASHFVQKKPDGEPKALVPKKFFGLSAFWSTVVAVELTDIVFSVDSILAAVALSNKQWVVITGGLLGIVAMRLVAGEFLKLIKKYPKLVEGAYGIVLLIGLKLFGEYFHYEVSKVTLFSLIGIIIFISIFWSKYAKEKSLGQDE